jgi:hypothetical protein
MNATSKGYSASARLAPPSQTATNRTVRYSKIQNSKFPTKTQSQPKRKLHASAREAAALESVVKLSVNLLLAVVAGSTLARLVPYNHNQQIRLTDLEQALTTTDQEKSRLWQDFSRNFDPSQAPVIIQEQSGRHAPNQRTVVWVDPLAPEPSAQATPE